MKSIYNSRSLNSNRSRQNSTSCHGLNRGSTSISPEPSPVLRQIKDAANRVTGMFKIFVPRCGKVTDASKSNSHQRRFSFSTDLSTEGNNRNSSRFKSFNSYGSSSNTSALVETTIFSIDDILKATQNFSQPNKIGTGCFGTVYKGKLKDGSLVAIKRAKKKTNDKHLSSEFKNEVLTLSKIEHRNLVRLYGVVEDKEERIIVIEYVSNGNLREHLDGRWGTRLEIAERLDIATDVAHAVTYLHMYTDPPIIHRDIKSPNILITEKLRAKVADFGFARLAPGDSDATHISTQVKGTTGYLDPEYLKTYQLTEKSDVYSFGVLLVEMMTGRHPIEQNRPLKERITIRWAMQRLQEGEAIFVMDPFLRRTPASTAALEEVLKLALRCIAPSRQSRPSMKECAEILWGIRKDFREAARSASSASTSQQSANYPHRDTRKIRDTAFGIEVDDNRQFISV
ncbi:hypothetical protein K2173_012261 [Erythroxylum novogranatense]|uniref:non-specific serine/threonine protein kinase n=1 Tax=Erythroxylum novogranatense TaxID=1862640 RepID=A0AAV8SC00_9ROSI|nr:hypothetical protein K2173_012261 [Erythroxylum novogranatense]